MNRKSVKDRSKILQLLVEGNSLRSTSRIADCSINTVTKLLVEVGQACAWYQDTVMRNLPCERLQVDEIWSFYLKKKKNVEDGEEGGDIWTWTSICPDTKLVPFWLVGERTLECAAAFLPELLSRMRGKVQLTSDGLAAYQTVLEQLPQEKVDFGRIVKFYAEPKGKRFGAYAGHAKEATIGDPDPKHISTSLVERQNLTMRNSIRRFTRKTTGFSKKIENHEYAVALHFMYYNFCRIHKSLKVTPAMESGIADRLWSVEDIILMSDSF